MSEMTRENAKKIDFYGSTLEECVDWLLKFQQREQSVVVEFNGHNLYSCDVTMDSAYIEITGQTKADFEKYQEKKRKENQERQEREKAETEAKMSAWIEKGAALIYPERMKKWKESIENGIGNIADLDAALTLMEKLENGASMEDVKELFYKQEGSGISAVMVKSLVFHFAKRGPEFYESAASRELSEEEKKVIEDKKRENMELEELHKIDSTKKVSAERRAEEKEIVELASEKEQLAVEIIDIEKQLEELRTQEKELKKETKSNEIDEK